MPFCTGHLCSVQSGNFNSEASGGLARVRVLVRKRHTPFRGSRNSARISMSLAHLTLGKDPPCLSLPPSRIS